MKYRTSIHEECSRQGFDPKERARFAAYGVMADHDIAERDAEIAALRSRVEELEREQAGGGRMSEAREILERALDDHARNWMLNEHGERLADCIREALAALRAEEVVADELASRSPGDSE